MVMGRRDGVERPWGVGLSILRKHVTPDRNNSNETKKFPKCASPLLQRNSPIKVQADTAGAVNKCVIAEIMFTMNSRNLPYCRQRDKTLVEPPLGPGSPEVARPQGEATLLPTKRTNPSPLRGPEP